MIPARGPPHPLLSTATCAGYRGILDDLGSGNGKITVIPHITILPFSEMHSLKSSKMVIRGDAWESPFCQLSKPKSCKMVIPPRVAVERGGDARESPFCQFQGLKILQKMAIPPCVAVERGGDSWESPFDGTSWSRPSTAIDRLHCVIPHLFPCA